MCSTKNRDRVWTFTAPVTLLATGGCGKVYLYTTNPDIATGDGVAMAYRAGAAVADMEFVQFHPTCLYHPQAKSFLISEAVRGEGGVLKSLEGVEFMDAWHPLKSLAPRDMVARAIDSEMKKCGAEHVWLDITHKPARFIIERFPNIYQTCLRYGIDITKEPIPGGAGGALPVRRRGDERGRRDGHCRALCRRRGGLHGIARREPAGEQFAFGSAGLRASRGGKDISTSASAMADFKIPLWQSGNAHNPDELVVVSHNWDEIRRLMWDYVGIVRTNKRLARAAETHRQPAGGNPRVLLEFHRDERPAGIAQHRHGGGIDCALRADAAGKPRTALQSGFPGRKSRMGPARHGFKKILK